MSVTRTTEERRNKARALRYKKAVLSGLTIEDITAGLEEIAEMCSDVQYWIDNGEQTLLDALDGDEEQEYEFKMMFSDLSDKCERLYDMLRDALVNESFDDFFVGTVGGGTRYRLVGYDDYEEDYYALTDAEIDWAQNESAKRLERLTKKELIETAGQCFGIVAAYYDLQYKYDYLKAAFDVLKDDNMSYLQMVRDIEDAYNKADAAGWEEYDDAVRSFERLVSNMPERAWIE